MIITYQILLRLTSPHLHQDFPSEDPRAHHPLQALETVPFSLPLRDSHSLAPMQGSFSEEPLPDG